MISNIFTNPSALGLLFSTRGKTIPEGSSTSIYAALLPDLVGGGYYSDCKLETKWVHALNDDVAVATKLWDLSVELAGKAGVDVKKA
jgi:hypothetical protein